MQENGTKRVYRSTKNKMIAGGFGLLFYILLAILIPRQEGLPGSAQLRENIQAAANDVSESIRKFAKDVKKDDSWFAAKRNILGLAVVVIGFVTLVHLLFPRTVFNWGVIWALLIIVAGIVILKKRTP